MELIFQNSEPLLPTIFDKETPIKKLELPAPLQKVTTSYEEIMWELT